MKKENQFDLVMMAKATDLTAEQLQFRNLHNQICYNAQQTAENFYNFLQSIRRMKTGEFYKSVGFAKFEDYTEAELGIKARQAYNYLEIADSLSEEFIRANARFGVTKLQLLTTLDVGEREELLKNIDLESASVREIKDAVAEEKAKRQKVEEQLSILQAEKDDLARENDKVSAAYSDLANEKKLLEKELKKAKEEPTIVYQKDLQAEADLKQKNVALEESEKKQKAQESKILELEAELKALKDKKAKSNDSTKEKYERRIRELELSLEEAKASKTTIASDKLVDFKVRFDLWQKNGREMLLTLNEVDESKREKCKTALIAVINKLLEDLK